MDYMRIFEEFFLSILHENLYDLKRFGSQLRKVVNPETNIPYIDNCGHCGETAGHVAIYKNNREILRIIIWAGMNPNATNCDGESVVFSAAKLGRISLLKALYETQKCDLRFRCYFGQPLSDLNIEKIKYLNHSLHIRQKSEQTDFEINENTDYKTALEICTEEIDLVGILDLINEYKNCSLSHYNYERDMNELIEGRNACQEYLREKMALDHENMKLRLTEEATEWQVHRKQVEKYFYPNDGIQILTYPPYMDHPYDKDGSNSWTEYEESYFDTYRVGVHKVAHKLFEDAMVFRAVKIGEYNAMNKVLDEKKIQSDKK
jgi:hypothetical protein